MIRTLLFCLFIFPLNYAIAQDIIGYGVNESELVEEAMQPQRFSEINKNQAEGDFIPLSFPLQAADELEWNSYYTVRYLFDHDAGEDAQDAFCNEPGNLSFDGNLATHFILYPFAWHLIENELVHVTAAASGTIIEKLDGNPDQLCDWDSEAIPNAIGLSHTNGTETFYGNMKAGSLTSKTVGETVAQGEILGVPGSSGPSKRPSLNFYVYDSNGNAIDPYLGACNDDLTNSLWENQNDVKAMRINHVSTHSADPTYLACPSQNEEPHFEDTFNVGETVYFRSSLRQTLPGQFIDYFALAPNGSVFYTDTYAFNDTYFAAWTEFSSEIPPIPNVGGIWTYGAVLNGDTVSTTFMVNEPLGIAESESDLFSFYPNPAEEFLIINPLLNQAVLSIRILDLSGRTAIIESVRTSKLNISSLKPGMYFIEVQTENGREAYPFSKN